MIVGRRTRRPFIREVSPRDLNLALDQCFDYATRGDVLITVAADRQYVLMSIERHDELVAANKR
jgi:hypothetical protein